MINNRFGITSDLDIKEEITISGNMKNNEAIPNFLCELEGFKTKCKNLHWSASNKDIHEYLDEYHKELVSIQDSIAEDYMGFKGTLSSDFLEGIPSSSNTALELIEEIRDVTVSFYNTIPQEESYIGITSECENFMHINNKYKYLFSLCK